MLVITRKVGEEIQIGGVLKVRVASIRGSRVKLAFEGAETMRVVRQEVAERQDTDAIRNGEFGP